MAAFGDGRAHFGPPSSISKLSMRMGGNQRLHQAMDVDAFNDLLLKRSVFIADLNPTTTASSLRSYLEMFGTVVEVEVFHYKETGLSKCVARAVFLDKESPQEVSGEFDSRAPQRRHHYVDGTRINVRRARRNPNAPPVSPGVLLGTLEIVNVADEEDYHDICERLRSYFAEQSSDQHVQIDLRYGDTFKLFFSADVSDATERVLAGGKRQQVDESITVSLKRCVLPWRSKEPQGIVQNVISNSGRLASASIDVDYYESLEHLLIRTEKLTFDDVCHHCRFSFDTQFRPHFIFKLASHDMPGFDWNVIEDRPNIFHKNCPKELAGLWLRKMFDIGGEIVQMHKRQCAERKITDKTFTDKRFSLVFHTGRTQRSRGWLGHIVFSLHTYFLFRLLHYRSLSPSTCGGRNRSVTSSAGNDGTSKAQGLVKQDCEEAVQRREEGNGLGHREECRWCSVETWPYYVAKVAEFVNDGSNEWSSAKKGSVSREASRTEREITLQILAKLARAEDRPGEPSKGAVLEGDSAVPDDLSLDTAVVTRLCGEKICLFVDKDKSGSAELAVNFEDMPPLCTAEPSHLGKVVQVLSELCRCLHVSDIRLELSSSQAKAEAFLEMYCSDFVRLLSADDARLWKQRWKESVMQGELISFRRSSFQPLCAVPPV